MYIKIREVKEEDAEMIYRWTQDPGTRKNAPDPKGFSLESHLDWFHRKLKDDNAYIFICLQNDTPVGQIRFEMENETEAIVSAMVNPDYRGQGIADHIFRLGIERFVEKLKLKNKKFINIIGHPLINNETIKKILVKSGFVEEGTIIRNGIECNLYSNKINIV